MAKILDEKTILNELHGGSAFFRPLPTSAQETMSRRVAAKTKKTQAIPIQNNQPSRLDDQSTDQSVVHMSDSVINQPTTPSDVRPASHSSRKLVDHSASKPIMNNFDMSSILPKPKAFYITEKQDEDLNILVRKLGEKLKGKTEQKIDRSVVTRLLLECTDLTNDITVNRLASHMTNRLTSQLASYSTE